MKITPFVPRIRSTLADATAWIREVTSALNNGATLADQMSGEVKSVTFNSASPPTVASKTRPIAVFLLSATLAATPSARISGGAVTWTQTVDGVLVSAIDGLTPSTDYTVMLWLVGG